MKDDSFVEFVRDQLRNLGKVSARRMFGAYGLYHGTVFFGIIDEGRLYFKVDDESKQAYIDRGMGPFRPTPKQTLKTYYEVPVDILEDDGELTRWAQEAVHRQQESKRKPTASTIKRRRK